MKNKANRMRQKLEDSGMINFKIREKLIFYINLENLERINRENLKMNIII